MVNLTYPILKFECLDYLVHLLIKKIIFHVNTAYCLGIWFLLCQYITQHFIQFIEVLRRYRIIFVMNMNTIFDKLYSIAPFNTAAVMRK